MRKKLRFILMLSILPKLTLDRGADDVKGNLPKYLEIYTI